MAVNEKLDADELTNLVNYVTGGEYTFGPGIKDGNGQPIGSLTGFADGTQVDEGAWPQSEDEDGVDYIGMLALQDHANKVYKLVADHGEDVVRMAARLMKERNLGAMHVDQLDEFVELNYKQCWDSPGAFAKQYMRGDDEGPAYDVKTLDELDGWIDWEGYAGSPDMSEFVFLKADGVDKDRFGAGVYVFVANPEIPE